MRASYVARLPLELQCMIGRFVLHDKHLLVRQLFKRLCRRLHRMEHPTAFELAFATVYWSAIASIGCYDDVIVKGVRRHHDIWYQELQDPYGVHGNLVHILMMKFHETLEPIMYGVAFSDAQAVRPMGLRSAALCPTRGIAASEVGEKSEFFINDAVLPDHGCHVERRDFVRGIGRIRLPIVR